MKFRERPQVNREVLAAMKPKQGDKVRWLLDNTIYIVKAVGLRYVRMNPPDSEHTVVVPLNEVSKVDKEA